MWLEGNGHEDAAASLREGIEEALTVLKEVGGHPQDLQACNIYGEVWSTEEMRDLAPCRKGVPGNDRARRGPGSEKPRTPRGRLGLGQVPSADNVAGTWVRAVDEQQLALELVTIPKLVLLFASFRAAFRSLVRGQNPLAETNRARGRLDELVVADELERLLEIQLTMRR